MRDLKNLSDTGETKGGNVTWAIGFAKNSYGRRTMAHLMSVRGELLEVLNELNQMQAVREQCRSMLLQHVLSKREARAGIPHPSTSSCIL